MFRLLEELTRQDCRRLAGTRWSSGRWVRRSSMARTCPSARTPSMRNGSPGRRRPSPASAPTSSWRPRSPSVRRPITSRSGARCRPPPRTTSRSSWTASRLCWRAASSGCSCSTRTVATTSWSSWSRATWRCGSRAPTSVPAPGGPWRGTSSSPRAPRRRAGSRATQVDSRHRWCWRCVPSWWCIPCRTGMIRARPTPAASAATSGSEHNGSWAAIDGYGDSPDLADAELGRRWLDVAATVVADALVAFQRASGIDIPE